MGVRNGSRWLGCGFGCVPPALDGRGGRGGGQRMWSAKDKESFSTGACALMMAGVVVGKEEIGGEGTLWLMRGHRWAVCWSGVFENTRG